MVAFIVIIFTVGYNQSPYTDLQIEFGRGRVWGLTPLGISLAILIVIYAGLFAIASDDQFLTRHGRGLKRLVIALVALCALAGAGYVGVDYFNTMQRNARRAEERAEWDRQRQAAQADWQQMTPQERGWMKDAVRLGFIPDSPKESERMDALKDFVPEVYQPLSDQEVADDARADWQTMTPQTRGTVKKIIQGQIQFQPDSAKERSRVENLRKFVPETRQPPTGDEIFDDPYERDILVALPPRKQQAAPTATPTP